MFKFIFVFLFIDSFTHITSLEEHDAKEPGIGIVILNQLNRYHELLSEFRKNYILGQAKQLPVSVPIKVLKSPQDFDNVVGHWTILPLLSKLSELTSLSWVFFLDESTNIDLKLLVKVLSSYNQSQDVFVGHALTDTDPTIIHHFANTDESSLLPYPFFATGFFMSHALIKRLNSKCADCAFSIDPQYELAKFIWNSAKVKLQHDSRLCLNKVYGCISWIETEVHKCDLPPIIKPKANDENQSWKKEDPLGFLRETPQFQKLREIVKNDPEMLEPMLQQMAQQNPQLLMVIYKYKEEFHEMLRETSSDSQHATNQKFSQKNLGAVEQTQIVSEDKIFVAVKTCNKFHDDRITVVKNTWASDVPNINYFSDVKNENIPTIKLPVPNVNSGHCEKTLSIMKYYVNNNIPAEWLVIVDDDTLLSFPRLKHLLNCYILGEFVALGERYGYSVVEGTGYDYLTGGSGMIFSMPTVKQLVRSCKCPSRDSPDDMIIGLCLKNLNIPITHSPLFHQARPNDYASSFLESHKQITFHKHWMIDPYTVYKKWLKEIDYTKHAEL